MVACLIVRNNNEIVIMQKNAFRCFITASANRSAEYEQARPVDTFDRHRFKSQKFHAPYENLSLHGVLEASPLGAVLLYVDYVYARVYFIPQAVLVLPTRG